MGFQNTTLATLQTRLAQRVDGQPFWTSDQARRAINEGLRIYNAITGIWKTPTSVTAIPNDPYLFVAGTLVQGTRVKIAATGRVLFPSSLYGFDHGLNNWEMARTNSGGTVPTELSYWAPVGLTEIALYPAVVVNTDLIVDGVRNTPVLVNAGDYMDLGDEEIGTLLGYALHALSFTKGIEAVQKTLPLRIAFFRAAAKRNAAFAASSLYRKIIGVDKTRFLQPMELPPSQAQQLGLTALEQGQDNGS